MEETYCEDRNSKVLSVNISPAGFYLHSEKRYGLGGAVERI
jgi:hypothetical protein